MTIHPSRWLLSITALLLPLTAAASEISLLQPGTGDAPLLLDNVVTGPTTKEAAQPLFQPETGVQRSVSEFLGHFSSYEQMYFIAGPVDPLAKFQFSFKYRLLNKAPLAKKIPLLGGINFSYTQLSLWQLDKNSAPFFDTNYMPEVFYSNEDIKLKLPFVSQLGLQTGFEHDSNGQAGATSRSSINLLFVRPILTFGDIEGFHAYVAPQLYSYIGDLSNNPDIYHYRGYCDLRGVIGWRQGLELSAIARAGARWNKGGVQVDLTYPVRDLLDKNVDVYVDAQYFNGYGETLLTYNQRTNAFRIGFALVR